MRHRNTTKTLGRKKAPREAMLRNLATSIILFEKVKTTKAKAKAVRTLVEKAITAGKKKDAVLARRTIGKTLYGDSVGKKVVEELALRYKNREGGYLRITNIGPRKGDGAEIVQIELV